MLKAMAYTTPVYGFGIWVLPALGACGRVLLLSQTPLPLPKPPVPLPAQPLSHFQRLTSPRVSRDQAQQLRPPVGPPGRHCAHTPGRTGGAPPERRGTNEWRSFAPAGGTPSEPRSREGRARVCDHVPRGAPRHVAPGKSCAQRWRNIDKARLNPRRAPLR